MKNKEKKIVVFIYPDNLKNNILVPNKFGEINDENRNLLNRFLCDEIKLYQSNGMGGIVPIINNQNPRYNHDYLPENLLVLWDQTVFMNGLPIDIQNFLYNATEVFFLRHTTNEQEQKEVIKKIGEFCNDNNKIAHDPEIEEEDISKAFYPKFCDILINLDDKKKAKDCFEELLKEFKKREEKESYNEILNILHLCLTPDGLKEAINIKLTNKINENEINTALKSFNNEVKNINNCFDEKYILSLEKLRNSLFKNIN